MLRDRKALIRTLPRCSPDSQSGNAVYPPVAPHGVFTGFSAGDIPKVRKFYAGNRRSKRLKPTTLPKGEFIWPKQKGKK